MSKGKKRNYSLPAGVKSSVEQSARAKQGLPPSPVDKRLTEPVTTYEEAGVWNAERLKKIMEDFKGYENPFSQEYGGYVEIKPEAMVANPILDWCYKWLEKHELGRQ